jgi:hypothetical protein
LSGATHVITTVSASFYHVVDGGVG